jgi:putative transposase
VTLILRTHLAVSSVVEYIKGKSAIHVARHFLKRERNYAGQHLWARGFYVDTVGRNTELIRKYIRHRNWRIAGWRRWRCPNCQKSSDKTQS